MQSVRFLFIILVIAGLQPVCGQIQTGQQQSLVDSLVRVADSMNRAGIIKNDSQADSPVFFQKTDSLEKTVHFNTPNTGRYELSGIVRDKANSEGIPFATVFFPGTQVGIPADLDGKFNLVFDKIPGDTLQVSAIGYGEYKKRIQFGTSRHQTLIIELQREAAALGEFVVHAGEDPAITLVKNIIAAKPNNNPDRLDNYKYRVYNKLEVDIRNLTKKQFESLPVPMIKKFGFIYDNLDTTTEDRPFLPFFLTEGVSDYYYRKDPKKMREFIRATQAKGVQNESIDQFLGSYRQKVNAYNNFMGVFGKQFVSPISDNALFYYKYRIKDTQMAYGHPIILVSFRPKRTGESCFYGDFWVVDSSYAIQRISLEVPNTANINYVSRVSLYQESAPVNDSLWFTIKDKFVSDFNLPYSPKLPGFIGRKTTYYSQIEANQPSIEKVLDDPGYKRDVIVADTAREQNDAFWNAARPDTLSKNEQAIYSMMDTLEQLPVFQRFKHTLKFLIGGYLTAGCFDIGPVYNAYNRNSVEGNRFRIGLATNERLWKNLRLSGYLAYGTRDEKFKYYGEAFWIMNREPRTYLFAAYRHDVDRSNNYYDNQIAADNIFSNIARKRHVPFKFAFIDDVRLEYYKQYYSGFSHMVTFQRRSFNPYHPLPKAGIFLDENGNDLDEITTTAVGLRLRYAYKEDYLEGRYLRQSLGSKYPIPELRFTMGIPDFLGSVYEYKKVSLSVSNTKKIPPIGKIYFNLFAGKTFGTLPYPLLDIAPGNEFHYYNRFAFNMMNRYEFISDEYAGFHFEHTIGGGIFNRIPYLRKAKLRQFWTAKGIMGSLSDENRALNLKPGTIFKTLERDPYIELGTGVENILQLFRLDFIWRVAPKPLPSEERMRYFGIFGSVKFQF